MRLPLYSSLLAAVLLTAGLAGQDKPAKDKDDPKPKPKLDVDDAVVEARFSDDSVVRMTLLQDAVPIQTRFGKLNVPVKDVRRIEFGLHYPEGAVKRIEETVAKLGSADFKEREAASTGLLEMRELAVPALRRAVAESKDTEVVSRAKELLKALSEKLPADRLRIRDHDVIQTTEFPIVGRVEATTLKVRTQYFGEVSVKLSDLRTLRSLARGSDKEVAVDAAKYGLPNNREEWLDTGIEIVADLDLTITAAGAVDLYPLAGSIGQYVTGPAGSRQWGVRGLHPVGTLLGRIGTNGKVFVIGEKYVGVPTDEGKLYLTIVGSPWGNASTGVYTVKVMPGRR
jgi:hypothetical protein